MCPMRSVNSLAVVFLLFSFSLTVDTGTAHSQTFNDLTTLAGIDVTGPGSTCTWIDYDADGDLDLFATNSAYSGQTIWLYRNNGSLPFTDVTAEAGFLGYNMRSSVWGDFDNDG